MAAEENPTNIKGALSSYADALERNPYDRKSILGSARLLRQLGETDSALAVLTHYLGKEPGDAEIRGLAGDWGWTGGPRAAETGAATGWSAAGQEKIYPTYADARPLVESVSGWLLEGQEQ